MTHALVPEPRSARRKILGLDDLAYLLYSVVPFRILCAAARLHGRVQCLVRSRERGTVRRNLDTAFGGEGDGNDLDRLTRRAFEYRQLRALLLTVSPRFSANRVRQLFPMEGLEHLDRARTSKGGVILLASHLNSICTIVALEHLRRRGYDLRLTLPSRDAPYPLSAFRRALYRSTGGLTFTERTGAFYAQFNIRPIVRALTSGSGVVIVGDGWHSTAFVKTEFLGHTAHFSTGAMSIGRLTRVPIVPLFILGAPPNQLRVVFDEPIHADPTRNDPQDIERMVEDYVRRLEGHVLSNVPCWQHWFEEDALSTMEHWPERSLADRYRIGPER